MSARLLLLALIGSVSALAFAPKAEAFTFIQRFGCPGDTGAAWPAHLLPSRWHIERSGYSPLPLGDVIEVLERSIDAWGGAWGNPCCSGFTHELVGLTAATPLDSDVENVVGFEESNWPRFLGSPWSVIAVTLPQIEPGSCEIHAADMLFNGVTFSFRTDGRLREPQEVDFESIAVHEFGHWIGLDHSRDPASSSGYLSESVMFPSYRGGTGDRRLYLDDKLGACALYPAACGDCQSDRDCPDGQACKGGNCQQIECSRDVQCPLGSVCGDDGRCHRGCRLHIECGEGFYCADGACLPNFDCAACRPCRRSRDCGGDYFCADFGEGARLCTKICSKDSECGGDAACHLVQGGFGYCGAPRAGDFCPSGYVCSNQACPNLGEACSADCGGRSDICVGTGSGTVCSCTCFKDADCGEGRCLQNPANGLRSCYPKEIVQHCGTGFCPPGAVCEEGVCLNLCNGSRCEPGEICEHGSCVPLCPECPPGEICDPLRRSCVIEESCLGVLCGEGERCADGACHPACGDQICSGGEECRKGRCVKPKESGGGGCSTGGGGAGLGAGLAILAMCAARRRIRPTS